MSDTEIQTPNSKLIVDQALYQSRNEIFLGLCSDTQEFFAIKAYPKEQDKVSSSFLNERRFLFLDHKNIISMKPTLKNMTCCLEERMPNKSFLIMEYAPYGNFYELLASKKLKFDETLARTYFRQLIEGLEYLHEQGVAHLDLKPHNLLLGNNFQLKIADFDLAMLREDKIIRGRGSKFYRAPELLGSKMSNPMLADIYSAGIFLFLMKTGGTLPHVEGRKYKGVNLFELMNEDNEKFWETHLEFLGEGPNFVSEDFKTLFNSMTKKKAKERASLGEIKKSRWYNGDFYDDKELERVMTSLLATN